ncbi:hypothetical protein MIN45_P1892 [Methylomarinovum tepidoasis]|uniref:HTH cro/C1-type domain-containing protein n=1 Tax=Methylomarinovum tepidoasis TaxID=2840183 RepID=A0AAU9CZP0_9GAMM|nr:helix-turn-helix transcriptional regulator [Methylomarinovum sp. IN45]BCX89519.1 hypothetical protein MIN45_P1892 [Methylomarinovum sp. IN45]
MKSTLEYIEEAKKKLGISSDNELAKRIGVNRAAVSQWKHGKSTMDVYACFQIAEILGIDPVEIITAANLEREKKEERRRYWEKFSRMRGWAAMLILGVISVIYSTPGAGNINGKKYTLCEYPSASARWKSHHP